MDYSVRRAASLEEARDFWWPHVRDLGWVCLKLLLTIRAFFNIDALAEPASLGCSDTL